MEDYFITLTPVQYTYFLCLLKLVFGTLRSCLYSAYILYVRICWKLFHAAVPDVPKDPLRLWIVIPLKDRYFQGF